MRKIILLLFLISTPFAQALESGKAYIVSSININSTGNIEAGQSYSLVPQIVVATGSENYAGSVTPFTGCYSGKRYEDGEEKGNCLTGVVNNLNSDSEIDALSAAQGKVLDNKITNLQNRTRVNLLNTSNWIVTETNSVTWNKNRDGTFTMTGTVKTDNFNDRTLLILYQGKNIFKGAKYVGNPYKGNSNCLLWIDYFSDINCTDFINTEIDLNGDIIIDDTEGIIVYCVVKNGFSESTTVTFKPMITNDLEAVYDDFVPCNITSANIDDYLYNIKFGDAAGKNLFDNESAQWKYGGIDGRGAYNPSWGGVVTINEFIEVEPNTIYTLSSPSPTVTSFNLAYYDGNKNHIGSLYTYSNGSNILSFRTTDTRYIKFGVWNVIDKEAPDITNLKIQLEKGNTATSYEPYIKSLKSLAKSVLNANLLWSNENVGSSAPFYGQTINLDYKNYKYLLIQTLYSNDYVNDLVFYNTNFVLTTNDFDTIIVAYTNAGYYYATRRIKLQNNGITFSDGMVGNDVNHIVCIPYRIYGIK